MYGRSRPSELKPKHVNISMTIAITDRDQTDAPQPHVVPVRDSYTRMGAHDMSLDELDIQFSHLYLQRVDPEKNARRFYYLAWQPTIFDGWAVVRVHGRIGGWQHPLPLLPYPTLEEAWPTIRAIIKRRLRHGYRIVQW
jgi:hypothetical protein